MTTDPLLLMGEAADHHTDRSTPPSMVLRVTPDGPLPPPPEWI